MRIGITQRVETVHGEQRDCLDRAWPTRLGALGHFVFPLPNIPGTARTWLKTAGIEAILLSGGNDLAALPQATNVSPERDRFESELIELCLEKNLPLLGVCRGMQRLLTHFGIALTAVAAHAGKAHQITTQDFPGASGSLTVNSFHNFGFDKKAIAAPWKVLAWAKDDTAEAVRHATKPLWGVMWHPERSPELAANQGLLASVFARGNP